MHFAESQSMLCFVIRWCSKYGWVAFEKDLWWRWLRPANFFWLRFKSFFIFCRMATLPNEELIKIFIHKFSKLTFTPIVLFVESLSRAHINARKTNLVCIPTHISRDFLVSCPITHSVTVKLQLTGKSHLIFKLYPILSLLISILTTLDNVWSIHCSWSVME